MKKYDVVGLGSCGVDFTKIIPSKSTESIISLGGVTANNLVQCARLGLKTAWAGVLGDDSWSDFLINKFREENIAVPEVVKIKNTETQRFEVEIDASGEKIKLEGTANATSFLSPKIVKEKFKGAIESAKHLHIEASIVPLAAAIEGAKIAKKSGGKILLDINDGPEILIQRKIGTKEELFELIKLADVVKTTDVVLTELVGISKIEPKSLNEILNLGPKIVFVTMAERGCMVADSFGHYTVPGLKVDAKNTAGAGDAFMGGLSFGILQGWDIKKVAEFANACGAYKTTRLAISDSGNLEEIKDLLKK